jgi:hypothetical protein
MDAIQFTIIAISFTLTILLVVIGVQMYYILKEVRLSVHKVNKMLDDAGKISGTVSDGVTSVSGFVNGIRAGISLIGSLKSKGESHE